MAPAVEGKELLQKVRYKHLKKEVEVKSRAHSVSDEWKGLGFFERGTKLNCVQSRRDVGQSFGAQEKILQMHLMF